MLVRPQTIRTKRLTLRPLKASDYEAWRRANDLRHPKKNPFDIGKRPAKHVSKAAFRKRVREVTDHWRRDRAYSLSIFHGKEYVGSVGLVIQTRLVLQTAGLGCNICNNRWREGFASEAVEAAVMFAFKKLKLHRIVAEIRTENRASNAAIKKVGFRKEGVAKKLLFEHGRWHDMFIYALTAEERGLHGTKPKFRVAYADV